jgi:hypothetical protein
MVTLQELADVSQEEFERRLRPIWNAVVDHRGRLDFVGSQEDAVIYFLNDALELCTEQMNHLKGRAPTTSAPYVPLFFNTLAILHEWEMPFAQVQKWLGKVFYKLYFVWPPEIMCSEVGTDPTLQAVAFMSMMEGFRADALNTRLRAYDFNAAVGGMTTLFGIGLQCREKTSTVLTYIEAEAEALAKRSRYIKPTHEAPSAKQ